MSDWIKIKRLHEDAYLPYRATKESVGYDLFAYSKTESGRPNKLLVPPRTTRAIPTGLIIVPPPGYSILIASRSGMAKERSLFVTNAPGIVDPDYRGEILVLLYNGGHESHYVEHGNRVGQMILLPFKSFPYSEVLEVDKTERGDAGFGSTGV
jgi:dUTP pyrophosphatase